MSLHFIDWGIVALFFILSLVIGLAVTKRAGASTADFSLPPAEACHGGCWVYPW